MQLQMQNDKLYTIKRIAIYFLVCSLILIVNWIVLSL
jgi:hypothetical protein